MNSILPFGHSITLNGRAYDLYIRLDYLMGARVQSFSILIPDGYQTTDLTAQLNGEFGEIMLRYHTRGRHQIGYQPPVDDLHIELFSISVNDIHNRKLATPDELKAMKGIGKKLMCFALKHMATIFPITAETSISLAAGGVVNLCDNDFYASMSTDQLFDRLKSKPRTLLAMQEYRKARRTIVPGSETFEEEEAFFHDFLARRICGDESNEALVNYYRTAYGFETTEQEYGVGAEMKASYGTVMGHC